MAEMNSHKSDNDIFAREKAGEMIRLDDPEFPKIREVISRAYKLTTELNNMSAVSKDEIRELFSKLIDREVDESFVIWTPFYTDFGLNINIGKNVFVNHACTFMDRGGITIEDDVLIGPKVNLITTSHPLEIAVRKNTVSKPIRIMKNAWIGAAATIMPGVTIGENAVVAAGALVTRDVQPNSIVGGVPAKMIKQLEDR